MKYNAIMTAEVKVDCYAGDTCDQQRKYFNIYCAGDMQDDDSSEKKLTIKLSELPPGARVLVQYPVCPECGTTREDKFRHSGGGSMKIIGHSEKCHCGFDWHQWVENEYA